MLLTIAFYIWSSILCVCVTGYGVRTDTVLTSEQCCSSVSVNLYMLMHLQAFFLWTPNYTKVCCYALKRAFLYDIWGTFWNVLIYILKLICRMKIKWNQFRRRKTTPQNYYAYTARSPANPHLNAFLPLKLLRDHIDMAVCETPHFISLPSLSCCTWCPGWKLLQCEWLKITKCALFSM